MSCVVLYKSKYGSAKQYAEWIGEELSCEVFDVKKVKVDDLLGYDTIILGGGLYAEVIAGATLITKNLDKLSSKKLVIFSTGITPIDCRDYYDKYVIEKNFKPEMLNKIKVFNFLGKMLVSELTLVHRTALKTLKKIMSGKENPTEMEKMLVDLCEYDADEMDKNQIIPLLEYVRN
ncbi:MAG: flavodoxin domain-containing protein [Clostridia bacterium]|nr:flavodoxin domain-containing protein [Clostridia bacterium]